MNNTCGCAGKGFEFCSCPQPSQKRFDSLLWQAEAELLVSTFARLCVYGSDNERAKVGKQLVAVLTATQQTLTPLTDEQIGAILHGGDFTGVAAFQRFARAIERAHGINTTSTGEVK